MRQAQLPPTCQYDQADDGAPCDLVAGDAVSDDGVCSDGQCVECTQNIHCDDGKGCTADVCDLTTWTCSNTLMGIGTLCRPAAPGSCDVAEHCNGTSEECPADGFQTSGFPCRGSLTECDKAELCSGDSPDCPEDVLQPDTHQCRPAAPGGCDAPEFCTGADPDCPEDVFLPDTHQCRPPASFDCDVAEFCTGDSAVCPDDIIVQPTTECGARSCSGLDWVMQMCGLSGTCSLSGPAEHCDDANACTTDACDASTGCSHSAPCAAGGYCYEQSVCMARYAHLECTDGDMQARLTAFSDEGGTIYHLKVDLDNDWDGCTSGWQESTTAAIDCGWSDTSVTGSLDGSGASLDAATLNCYPYPASSPCACTASGPWQL